MKKVLFSIIVVLLLITLAACRQKDEPMQIENPWRDHETLTEACSTVGFDLAVPDHIDGYDAPIYRTLNNEFIEVLFPAEGNDIRIRKAVGGEIGCDISGDYTDYHEYTAILDEGINGIIAGTGGAAGKATWGRDGYSYSITANPGLDIQRMRELIDVVQ